MKKYYFFSTLFLLFCANLFTTTAIYSMEQINQKDINAHEPLTVDQWLLKCINDIEQKLKQAKQNVFITTKEATIAHSNFVRAQVTAKQYEMDENTKKEYIISFEIERDRAEQKRQQAIQEYQDLYYRSHN